MTQDRFSLKQILPTTLRAPVSLYSYVTVLRRHQDAPWDPAQVV